MDDLLSQDEINALLSGGDLGGGDDSDLSMEDSHLLSEVSSIFAGAGSSVIGMLSGKEVDTAVNDAEVVTQADFRASLPEGPFLFTATFGGFDDIPLALAVEQKGALTLADLMMGGEGKDLPDEPSDLYLNAAQEGLSQVVGSSFTSLSGARAGTPFCSILRKPRLLWRGMRAGRIFLSWMCARPKSSLCYQAR